MKQLFHDDKLVKILERTKIFSREDLDNEGIKNLAKIADKGERLENSIILDDKPGMVGCSQIMHWLCIEPVRAKTFSQLSTKSLVYRPDGYRYLKCQFVTADMTIRKEFEQIFVEKKDKKFLISYPVKKYNTYYSVYILDNSVLIKNLETCYQKNISQILENTHFEIDDPKLIRSVCRYVRKLGGDYQKICHKVNQIFHITGLFFHALSICEKSGKSLSTTLSDLQWKKIDEKIHLKNYGDEFYLKGLEILRKYNPELKLVSPHDYVEIINQSISEEEKENLSLIINNTKKNCCKKKSEIEKYI